MSIKAKWNERYRVAAAERQAARVLKENLHLLPDNGHALDLACGLGGNSILLAQQGLKPDSGWSVLQARPGHTAIKKWPPKEPSLYAICRFLFRDILSARL